MKSFKTKGTKLKSVDCALIFMLDEEKNLFLKNNKDYIITNEPLNGFSEFIFFDKDNNQRTGVMCSNGKEMGNTQACKLFYKLSRYYSASLYINLGVAGLVEGINIGDVIIVDRLSTSGERNDNIGKTQIQDYNHLNSDSIKKLCFDLNNIINKDNQFSLDTKNQVQNLKSDLANLDLDFSQYAGFDKFEYNNLTTGWCLTVPKVIKNKSDYDGIHDSRKLNIVDMEAYYLASWYDNIKDYEPHLMKFNQTFLIFKSVSDYGDSNKTLFEKAKSRELAMQNLYSVVTAYCTQMHKFCGAANENIYTYLNNEISRNCIDPIVSKTNIPIECIEELFEYIIYIEDSSSKIKTKHPVSSLLSRFKKSNQAILLTGRSGTGKSTFISFLFLKAEGDKVLIDFSKYDEACSIVLVHLLERLMRTPKKYLIFLDGVKSNSTVSDELQKILNSSKKSNVTFCIGNYEMEIDSIATILSTKDRMEKIFFGSVNINSPQYDDFISTWAEFSKAYSGHLPDTRRVLRLIANAKFDSVDFRLLNMFTTYKKQLPKDSLPSFIRKYIINKYKLVGLNDYWEKYLNPDKHSNISQNQYLNSVAIATGIVELFESNFSICEKRVGQFIKRDFILSNDMNLLLEHILKSSSSKNIIINNMINLLTSSKTINVGVETQLIYNICRVIDGNDIKYTKFKSHIDNITMKLQHEFENDSYTDIHNFIKYRTLCIIQDFCFSNPTFLMQFNKNLLSESSKFIKYNLIFYLLYYSKRELSFSEIINFNTQNTDYEMFCNTFYTLKKELTNSDIQKELEHKSPLTIMNIITFISLTKLMLKNEIFTSFVEKANEIRSDLIENIDKALEVNEAEQKVLVDIKRRLLELK